MFLKFVAQFEHKIPVYNSVSPGEGLTTSSCIIHDYTTGGHTCTGNTVCVYCYGVYINFYVMYLFISNAVEM